MSKYNAQKTRGFDSKKEARRADELRLMERAGAIRNLRYQVEYVLIPAQYINGRCVERDCKYRADFVYYDKKSGQLVVEDCKGFKTPEYRIKRKLMLRVYGIRIKET